LHIIDNCFEAATTSLVIGTFVMKLEFVKRSISEIGRRSNVKLEKTLNENEANRVPLPKLCESKRGRGRNSIQLPITAK